MLAVGIWEKPAAAVVVMCCRWSVGALIHQHLGAGRSVVNVGAGARSYKPADRCVLAGGALRGDALVPVVHRGGAGDRRRRRGVALRRRLD